VGGQVPAAHVVIIGDRIEVIRTALLLLCVVISPACIIAPDRVNVDCNWTHDPSGRSEESHLLRDVAVAEELAIRYADAHYGYASGHHAGARAYESASDQCLATLLTTIATNHSVDAGHVRSLLHRRSPIYDVVVVFLPMALLLGMSADAVVRWIRRRFTSDEKFMRTLSLITSSIVLTVIELQVGSIWSFLSEEEIRLRTNHLSYRAFYVPWSRHAVAILLGGFCLFWIVASVRIWNEHRVESDNITRTF
jgi:hypothetical protein